MPEMYMIVGLGNPGPQYARNRHNIGFQCLDLLAQRARIEMGKVQQRARVGSGWLARGDERRHVLLVKPMTYMNASGDAVAALVRFYQVPAERILVIHDDLDLASGKLRLRPGGSAGGQNGIKSIIQRLGTQEFHRARIGIGRPPAPSGLPMDPADYVLLNFTPEEEKTFGPLRERVCDAVECWLFEGIEAAMNRFNG